MDDFNNKNSLNGFDSFEAKPEEGEIAQEQNVGASQNESFSAKEPQEVKEQELGGYTVTPQGGYYGGTFGEETETKPSVGEVETADVPDAEKTRRSYFPSGNYDEPSPSFKTGGNYFDPQFHKAPSYTPTGNKGNKPQKTKRKAQKKSFGMASLIAVSLITALVCCGCFYVLTLRGNAPSLDNTDSKTTVETKVVEIEGSIEELAQTASQKAGSCVVGVQTAFAVQNFFRGQSTSTGSGSGVIYKSDGYIITNYHVIEDTLGADDASITVFLNNDTEKGYKASVINYNISCDLAVLKIDKTGLDAIDIGNSDDLKVGQYVVAIGSPAGLEFMGSTTFGIVSGLNRKIDTTNGNMTLIQTDAAINPGNSGGALVNTKGELIGISSSKLVDESYEGMGFAIPVNTVVDICDGLIAHEGEGDPYTGISISSNYTSRVLDYYGYPVGAVVASVDEGSPAQKAGIKRGDIITKFGDVEISEYTLYASALSSHFPGDNVKVTYYRSGEHKTVNITIGSSN